MRQSASTADPHAHLRHASAVRKASTLARLKAGLAQLAEQGREVSLETIREVTSLHPRTITRNPEAYALFRAHSTHLQANRPQRQKPRRQPSARVAGAVTAVAPPGAPPVAPRKRDSLENYSKTRLIRRVRRLEADLSARAERDAQYHALLQEHTRCALTIEHLEDEVRELVTYRTMLGQLREKLRGQEHGTGS